MRQTGSCAGASAPLACTSSHSTRSGWLMPAPATGSPTLTGPGQDRCARRRSNALGKVSARNSVATIRAHVSGSLVVVSTVMSLSSWSCTCHCARASPTGRSPRARSLLSSSGEEQCTSTRVTSYPSRTSRRSASRQGSLSARPMLLFPELEAPFNKMMRPLRSAFTAHNLPTTAVGMAGELQAAGSARRAGRAWWAGWVPVWSTRR